MSCDCSWPLPPTDWQLTKNEVQVWCTTLDQPYPVVSRLVGWLTADEQARANRYKFPRDRDHFIVGRGALRLLLGCYLSKSPAEIKLTAGRQGKPALSSSPTRLPLKFNLSHSHGLMVVALTLDREVGVDVEQARSLDGMAAIAKRFFSKREYTELQTLERGDETLGFFNCWTRKEAYIKAIGDGLSHALDSFDVSLQPDAPARLLRDESDPNAPTRWQIHGLAPAVDFVGALCVEGLDHRITTWRLPLPALLKNCI